MSSSKPRRCGNNLELIEQLLFEQSQAILAIEIQILANEEAALRSPQCADWSNGVAKGLRIALDLLGTREAKTQPPTKDNR